MEDAQAELTLRFEQLNRWYSIEHCLVEVAERGGGIAELVLSAARMTSNPMWLIDPRRRVVARSEQTLGSSFRAPELDQLLARQGLVDLSARPPMLVRARPAQGLARRHLVVSVAREDRLFAWLVMAEVGTPFSRTDHHLVARTAMHLATEYAVQRRVAQASWNARSALARQLVRGSRRDDDLVAAADYLGVRVEADRVLVYLADGAACEEHDEEELSRMVEAELGLEVLGTRGREGTILLIEAPAEAARQQFVDEVKEAMRHTMASLGEPAAVVGVSGVTRPDLLQRAYRETREVVTCVDRFARSSDRVIAVDDLGPARLFVANGDPERVRRYARDVLGGLLGRAPGSADLLRTLQCFFETGRSVRESAARLGIHENTVRLRLAKVHDLTGLDVASDAQQQLSAQTALLVLRLEGHPTMPALGVPRPDLASVAEVTA